MGSNQIRDDVTMKRQLKTDKWQQQQRAAILEMPRKTLSLTCDKREGKGEGEKLRMRIEKYKKFGANK